MIVKIKKCSILNLLLILGLLATTNQVSATGKIYSVNPQCEVAEVRRCHTKRVEESGRYTFASSWIPNQDSCLHPFNPNIAADCTEVVDFAQTAKELKEATGLAYLNELLQNNASLQDQRQKLETILEDMRRIVSDSAQNISNSKSSTPSPR
ncbi:MAG: hypothetical protein JWQ35_362 [Bacteriovoracaceae bacterium]|nr:hypothetical protein [Bacteriovoracaceae bacterium]